MTLHFTCSEPLPHSRRFVTLVPTWFGQDRAVVSPAFLPIFSNTQRGKTDANVTGDSVTMTPTCPDDPVGAERLPEVLRQRRTYRRTPFADGAPVAERLVVIDRLRGMALLGVAAVNLSVFVSDAGAGASRSRLDRIFYWLNYTLLNGKCFPILAAVFGYSLGLQLQRPGDVHGHRRVFKRRLFVLGVLGLAHGFLLYRFDILLAYALLGMCTYWLRHIGWRSLVALCTGLVLIGSWLLNSSGIDPSGLVRIGPALAIDRYRYGSVVQLVDLHIRNFSANFSREIVGQWPFVLAMLLLGVFAERFDFARRSTARQRLGLVGIGISATVLTVFFDAVSPGSGATGWMGFAVIAMQPLMSLGAIGGVMMWCARSAKSFALDAFGRMSLSCYLAQSMVFSLTLYGFGFGLFHWFSPTVQVLYLLGFLTIQIQLARLVMQRYSRGPMEALVDRWSKRVPVVQDQQTQQTQQTKLGTTALLLTATLGMSQALPVSSNASCPTSRFRSNPPLVIAHASSSYFGPPNTLEMLRAAVRAGADVVDADVRLSADGVLVAAHDDDLSGTSNGKGSLRTQSFSALRKLDFGWAWKDPQGRMSRRGEGVKIPSVEEVLNAFPNRQISLEFKVTGGEATLCSLLRRLQRTKDVYISSAGDEAINTFKPLCPEVTTTVTDAMVPILRAVQTSGKAWCAPVPIGQPPFSRGNDTFVSKESVAWNHAHGLAVYTWTLDSEQDLRAALAAGVDAVYTGRADLARKIFGPRK